MKTSKNEFDKRIEICKKCPSIKPLLICGECGCFMKVKAWIKNIKCPKNNWR